MGPTLTLEDHTVKTLRERAAKLTAHSRTCKKAPDDCATCQKTIAWFREIPTSLLSRVLAE